MSTSTTNRPRLSSDELRILYHKEHWRPLLHTALTYAGIVALFSLAIQSSSWWVVALVFPLMGALQHRISIIHHEANHFLLAPDRAVNDLLGAAIAGTIGFTMAYRDVHLTHHRVLGAPDDPDLHNYQNYPGSLGYVLSDVAINLLGVGAVKQALGFVGIGGAGSSKESKGQAAAGFSRDKLWVLGAQLLILTVLTSVGAAWAYFVLWILPLLTVAKGLAHFRNVAEHILTAGRGEGEFARFRTLYSHPVERFFFAPMWFNYHAEHHLYPGIPYYNLPAAHRALMEKPEYRDQMDVVPGGYLRLLWNHAIRSPAQEPVRV